MSRLVTQASWADAPHITPAMIADFAAKIPPHQKQARMQGVPHIGSGAIYPIPDTEIVCPWFKIPDEWPRIAGGDISKTWNAFVWGAWDRDSDVVYIYDDYKRNIDDVDTHAMAFKKKHGAWMPLVADAADIRSDQDRRQYVEILRQDHEIDVELPDKAVETGLSQVFTRMQEGRLKIFASCGNVIAEKRMYRRDKQGKIVKENDHCLDALRYLVRSGLERAIVMPKDFRKTTIDPSPLGRQVTRNGWMG